MIRPSPAARSLLRRLRATLPRRSASTETPAPKPASPPATSPQTTILAWLEPAAAPFRAYGRMQARSPYTTQLCSSVIIYFLGDLSAQLVSTPVAAEQEAGRAQHRYDPGRGLRAMAIGAGAALPSYHWFLFLGRHFNYASHAGSLAAKIVVNQAVFTPCINSYFFGMHGLLAGRGLAETAERIVAAVPTSMAMSWMVWPAVTAFSFTFVRPQYRSVTAGVVAIFWQTYLSWLNGRAARAVALKAEGMVGRDGEVARAAAAA